MTADGSPDLGDDENASSPIPDGHEHSSPVTGSSLSEMLAKAYPTFGNVGHTPAVTKIAAEIAKQSSSKLHESILGNIAGMSGLAAQHSKLAETLKAQTSWGKQFEAINSDIFRGHLATQQQLAKMSAQITKNIDFGMSGAAQQFAQQFASQQSAWLKALGPTLKNLETAFYPSNLCRIENLRLEAVETVVMADGIGLYGVPRPAIAEAILDAENAAKRREILGRRSAAISADCRKALDTCESEAVATYVRFAHAALDAFDARHDAAAQALTGSLIDSLVNAYFGTDRHKYTPNKGVTSPDAYEELTIREFIALAPMWQTYQQFRVSNGDRIPMTFNRHATAHTVSPRQFNRRNAIQGLLFAVGFIYFLDERAQTTT